MFTALATLALVGIGGLVTSKGVGMAVPDWPTTYGYNMFLVPFDQWLGKFGIFEEHSHRLMASFVGFLTIGLAIWLWAKEARKWVRLLGIGALVLVVVQGVLGGLRVTEINQNLGLIHGAVAQLFLILVCAIALVTSAWWQRVNVSDRAGFAALNGIL
ncbi:MAG TPA: COX15/CtaA family protein, partial [Verrucomicrobiota bacterium]|nr:COX15/CtaA family protein [Verrucomicrobiota bacterium]